MLFDSTPYIVGQANVKFSIAVLDNVNAIKHRGLPEKLVAGAGFEPAVPQQPDYEPNRDRPVIL